MELGTAVFLSAVLLSLVGLYAATKDRWNWKKVFLWLLGVLVTLAALAGGGVYIYTLIESRPKPQTSFWNIPLNATEADVKFLKGEPTKREDVTWTYETKQVQSDPYYYVVQFEKSGKLRFVMYYGAGLYMPFVQGISSYSSQEAVVEKFGPPTYTSTSKDGLRRILSYSAYNLFFGLRQNRVESLGMYDGTGRPLQFSDDK
jgi:hypothetical protein